ncbi:DUF6940 family protein [Rhodohalobacter sulfatireducens]|uniref:Uncharacterized protein n=1 Tax=Rhodohalobacter sulfatireducens TaxID=2911366 RepID=A0ABS9KFQ0_9BACT|nr:hypothetical protein [Rhodohalobacter sulfatireducens]MCG2589690.1 hypothetical protein [Rhodohalobacter sulfatireducens]
MWSITEKESTNQSLTFGIDEDGDPISNQYFLELLSNSQPFRKFYNGFLADSDYDAFFWENRPITNQNLEVNYECNIINSDFLASRSPDSHTFRQYFDSNKKVVTFPNLGNDAQLIAPCPQKEDNCYTHIGSFVRKADEDQIDKFWQITGHETLQAVNSKPKWLSTSGLGVFWLHVRIDTIPKYYQTKEYKKL